MIAGTAAAILWTAVAAGGHAQAEGPPHGFILGVWNVLYSTNAPGARILGAAVALAVLLAAGVALLERRITTRSRRSANVRIAPLAPKVVMAATRGVYAGPITVTVLIPAHNEEVSLPSTIASLRVQSRSPERIIVVADNCTDSTVEIAHDAGVELYESVENTKK